MFNRGVSCLLHDFKEKNATNYLPDVLISITIKCHKALERNNKKNNKYFSISLVPKSV